MSEQISNKELAKVLSDFEDDCHLHYKDISPNHIKALELAAERLAAMPDAGEIADEIDIGRQRKEFERLVDEFGGYSAIHGDPVECFSWFCSGVNYATEILHNQPQQPAPDKAPTDNGVPELDSICAEYNNGQIDLNSLVCHAWNKALHIGMNDKETIKRYCLAFARYWDDIVVTSMSMEDVFNQWLQQQSAEGGE